jgi:hypothetical protein
MIAGLCGAQACLVQRHLLLLQRWALCSAAAADVRLWCSCCLCCRYNPNFLPHFIAPDASSSNTQLPSPAAAAWQQPSSPTQQQQQLSTGPAAAAAAAGALGPAFQDAAAAAQRLGASQLHMGFLDRPGQQQQQQQHHSAAEVDGRSPPAAAAASEDDSDSAEAGSQSGVNTNDTDALRQQKGAELDSVRQRIFDRALRFRSAVDDEDTAVVATELRSYACGSSSELITLMSAVNGFLREWRDCITGVIGEFGADPNGIMFGVDVSTPDRKQVRMLCGITVLVAL